jgi:hypothetical protein
MEDRAQKVVYEVHYKILECCVTAFPVSKSDIAKHLKISEDSNYTKQLLNSKLIEYSGGNTNFFQLTSDGMSAFLSIRSQKQSSKQARIAIYIAVISMVIAVATLLATIYMKI